MKLKTIAAIFGFILPIMAFSQNIKITGKVLDASTNKPISGAELSVEKTNLKSKTNSNGEFSIELLEPGFYVVTAAAEGFKSNQSFEQLFTYDKQVPVTIELESMIEGIGEVSIRKSALQKRNTDNPLSAQELSLREIEKNPGGNRDISKIIQSLPGVISIPGFRNDIVIRGGSPAENKFYLDGIEIPIINHFQTQGSTGGPVGLLNVNFIKNVNFYTGAFPVNLANGLSSVIDFQQTEGNRDKSKFRFTVGSSDLGFTTDGPIGKKATYIFSARQSYLQGLFTLLKLPFLPSFIDYQGKVKIDLKGRDDLTIITVGAFDNFKINTSVNEGITDSVKLKSNKYILGYLPDYTQWNYTFGAVYTHYGKKNKTQWFLSRNMLNNETFKYKDNDDTKEENLNLKYRSTEEENKFRVEHSGRYIGWKWLVGGGLEYAQYGIETYNKVVVPTSVNPSGILEVNINNGIELFKYNAFFRATKNILSLGTTVSASARLDGASFGSELKNPFKQPTISISTSTPLSKRLFFNMNVGQFHQLPAYSVLGYRSAGNLVNKDRVKYIRNRMAAAGFQYNQGDDTKITFEGFYKRYSNYPFALNDSINIGNLGADFAVVGNEPIVSTGGGQAYGTEFLIQRRSRNGVYGILSYTLAWSQFEDKNGNFIASSWDSRHTVSLTAGKKFKKNWEVGAKWRFVTGRPYTPYDVQRSMAVSNWDARGIALLDYNQLNNQRLGNFNQFDLRVDKVWYKKKWSLNLYIDIQNLLGFTYLGPETLIAQQTADGTLVKNANNPLQYNSEYLPNESGTVLPTIGIIFDF